MNTVTEEQQEMTADPEQQGRAPFTRKPGTGPFARQRYSIFGKIALGISIWRALGGLGGAIAITLSNGAPSRDIVTVTTVSLAMVIILATQRRWAALASIPLATYLLILTFTQPFALSDLEHPKGPDGFILFITAVLAFAASILALGGCLGEAVMIYAQKGRKTPRWVPAALCMVVGMIIGAIYIGAISPVPAPTGTTYTNGVPTVHIGPGNFLQPSVTITKGSKLLLVDDTTSEHDLYNGSWQNGSPITAREPGAPLVNGVQLKSSSIVVGPFTTAGTYHIYCLNHKGMILTIVVQ